MRYIKQFIFFSVIGYIFERLVGIIMQNNFDSGILYGPYTPIYGFGILIIIYGSDYIFKYLHLKRYQENLVVFGLLFFTITILELVGGILIEKIFGTIFWSYENLKFNYGHYIAIEVSLLWSVGGLIIYYFKNYLLKFVEKIPNIIYYLFMIAIPIDVIYTIIKI